MSSTPLADLLLPGRTLREVTPRIYSARPQADQGAAYDSRAAAYDRMVSSDLYLKMAWGARRSTILDFMRDAFASGDGPILDLAAGTSVDAVHVYPESTRPIIVADLSLEMLHRGRLRIIERLGAVPDNLTFLQADAFDLPFVSGSIQTVLCHGAFHLLPELPKFVAECCRVLPADGGLFVSSLVAERAFGNAYLRLLHRSGEVSAPRRAAECQRILASASGRQVDLMVEGNFAYLRC